MLTPACIDIWVGNDIIKSSDNTRQPSISYRKKQIQCKVWEPIKRVRTTISTWFIHLQYRTNRKEGQSMKENLKNIKNWINQCYPKLERILYILYSLTVEPEYENKQNN